jgi:hypothetical protein
MNANGLNALGSAPGVSADGGRGSGKKASRTPKVLGGDRRSGRIEAHHDPVQVALGPANDATIEDARFTLPQQRLTFGFGIAPFVLDGPINRDALEIYVEQVLVPELRPSTSSSWTISQATRPKGSSTHRVHGR